ncbi:MAG TPA: type ISP restriction/modification enzyme [Thermoanaerobaculia bacterium]|jgi:predicted helicase|nr:type ISP restriction/modification enzyme [Thermoanaerobaculia bacterium]
MNRSAEGDLRRVRGIYRTPRPLVQFVIRSVDLLLRTRFGCPEGLGSQDVRLLDPAAGPMNFLAEACRIVLQARPGGSFAGHFRSHFAGIEIEPKRKAQGEALLRRLHGASEPVPVPIHLGDALQGPYDPFGDKGGGEIEAIVGNPPWRGHSANQGSWIRGLLRGYVLPDGRKDEGYFRVDGAALGERNPKWLSDDYVKFLRLAQWRVDHAGQGIVAFVVSHTCLEAPTFRGLRRSLLSTFDEIYALDLHGNRRKRESTPEGGRDEGVFPGVAQGAAALFLVKRPGLPKRAFRADLYGPRRAKLRTLGARGFEALPWQEIRPQAPAYLFAATDARIDREFQRGLPLAAIFPVHAPGVITGNDALLTGLDRHALEARLAKGKSPAPHKVCGFLVRPFDIRFLLYEKTLLSRPRSAIVAHMRSGENLGLVVSRQTKEEFGAVVTRLIPGHKVVTAFDTNSLFPLYLDQGGERVPNLAAGLLATLSDRYGVALRPEDVFHYVYATLYHPAYRRRFRENLRREFPRIGFPAGGSPFLLMSAFGRELVALHLLEDPRLAGAPVGLEGDARAPLQTVCPVYKARDCSVEMSGNRLLFRGIPPETWEYRVGAYVVLSRWLKARSGRILGWTEMRTFRRIVASLTHTQSVQAAMPAEWGNG